MKIKRLVIMILIALLFAVPAFAAGTITGAIERIETTQGRPRLVILTLTCLADSVNGSFPAAINISDMTALAAYDLRGLKLYSVATIPGAVGPTDNSDMTLLDRYGIDILAGTGSNIIDNTALNRVVIGGASAVLVTGDLTITITGNSVNSAAFTIVLELTGL